MTFLDRLTALPVPVHHARPAAADRPPAATRPRPPTSSPADPRPAGPQRLRWLDALRGIAALAVVYWHFSARVLPDLHTTVDQVFDPGLYGVLVFFLVSGYIVPASLERRGDIRAFWISRLFRLFPLFALVIAATLLLHLAGLASLRDTGQHPLAAVLAHLLMLDDLLGGTNLIVVIWTLSYEMVFYILLTALFTAGAHRHSARYAAIFAASALLFGGVLPTAWLSYHVLGLTGTALVADVLVIGGLGLACAAGGWPRRTGAAIAASAALALVVLNGRRFGYEGLTILALMFTGTLIFRAQHGQTGRRQAAAVTAGIFAVVIAAGAWHAPALAAPGVAAQQQRQWVMSVVLAGLTFAAGFGLRNRKVPGVLAWLGLVSYSTYLILPLLLDLYDDIPFPSGYRGSDALQVAAFAVFTAALIGCAALTYYRVEIPMQRLGRRAATASASRPAGSRLINCRRPAAAVARADKEAHAHEVHARRDQLAGAARHLAASRQAGDGDQATGRASAR